MLPLLASHSNELSKRVKPAVAVFWGAGSAMGVETVRVEKRKRVMEAAEAVEYCIVLEWSGLYGKDCSARKGQDGNSASVWLGD